MNKSTLNPPLVKPHAMVTYLLTLLSVSLLVSWGIEALAKVLFVLT